MFYGRENDKITSKRGGHCACTETEGITLSKIICEYCGTIYDSNEGRCPICGANQAAGGESAPVQAKEATPSMDDTIIAVDGLLPKGNPKEPAGQPEKKPAAQRETEVTSTEPVWPEPEESQPEADAPKKPSIPTELMEEKPEEKQKSRPVQPTESGKAARDTGKPFRAKPAEGAPQREEAPSEPPKPIAAKKQGVSRRDQITCAILGVAVALFALYIGYRFARPYLFPNRGSSAETTEPAALNACQAVTADASITFHAPGESRLLSVTLTPADTTDTLSFQSSDPSVATVTAEGTVVAVAPGQATITITCGQAQTVCNVLCDWVSAATDSPDPATDTTAATEPAETTEPAEPDGELSLDREDITFFQLGETTRLRVSGLDASQLTWSSDNSAVASVTSSGLVTAEAPGTTRIRATYGGQELVCIVRCNFEEEEPTESSGSATISHTDVTLTVDESFTLRLEDSEGNTLEVTWTPGNTNVCTVSGNTVTAVGAGYTEITATYDGETYTCIVRVRE